MMNFAVHPVEDASIASMIVAEVAMVVATMIITAAILATTIVNVARTDAEMTMGRAALTGMPPLDVKIATVAVGTTAAVATITMVETADVRETQTRMRSRCRRGSIVNHTVEVEPLTNALTIGIRVDKSGQLNLTRCGALSQITRPALSAARKLNRLHLGSESNCSSLIPSLMLMRYFNRISFYHFVIAAALEKRSAWCRRATSSNEGAFSLI